MPRERLYENAHERTREASKRRRERERADKLARCPTPVVKLTAGQAVELYRTEKAKSDERNAAKREAISASIKAALAKADEDKRHAFRVGRPKRLPDLCLTSDKANALVNALASWHE